MLQGKTIVVGVSGGIAAYKAADLVSRLKNGGAEVHVIMTKAATQFVSPLTFRTLSGNPVTVEMFQEPQQWNVAHVSLAERAHLFLLVPATANLIGKLAHGIADDFLTTAILATRAPIMLAPAMNVHMYENPIVQANLNKLQAEGYILIEPEEGRLACGDVGKGRLASLEMIINSVITVLLRQRSMDGIGVLVTAGGTREAIDPVRYISNHSSGKMGYALAAAAKARGARVILVTAPTALQPPAGVEVVEVESALEMREAVMTNWPEIQVVIKAAAVADYRPAQMANQKMKKSEDAFNLKMVRNPDILQELGQCKGDKILVGFAAETDNLQKNAEDKLRRKNVDLLVANDVTREGAGFGSDTNIVSLLYQDGRKVDFPRMKKTQVAERIMDAVEELRKAKESN